LRVAVGWGLGVEVAVGASVGGTGVSVGGIAVGVSVGGMGVGVGNSGGSMTTGSPKPE
jgi:hypothetical protein